MAIRLTRPDFRTIVIIVLLAAGSLAVAIKYFSRAFPEASITFRVDRNDSLPIARQFLEARGLHLNGYDHAAIFNYSDDTKLYLEQTQGLDAMNRLARGPVHLWRWQHRWFRSQQKEELLVAVTPLGEVVGFNHVLAEAAPGANLDEAAARKLAEDFLTGAMKRDLGDLEFVEADANKRPARTDHTFTWKQKSVNLGDGSLRVEVKIAGGQVAGYQEYVKIPDQWQRDYERLRSRNDAAQLVDQVFWILLSVAMLAVLILRLRDRDVPLRLAGTAGLMASVLFLLGQLNTFSLSKFGYPTTDPYSGFLAGYIARTALAALGVGLAIFLLVAAAEPMYREGMKGQLALRRAFTWRGLRTRSFFIANVVGLGLTFFFFAYQTLFYLIANRLGAWAPSDIPFTNDLNTSIPWVAVLFGGFLPAVLEEMQFRAFALPFLHKYLRNWPLAILLAAFNWGFLHSAYPNEPFFIRGLEVGLGGIVIGFVMLRFGVIATLIWHYSVDALYTAFLLLRSPNHYLMLSGGLTAGIMLVPLLVALVAYWRTGTFADDAELTNAAEGIARPPRHEEVTAEEAPLAYRPLSRRRLLAAGGLVVLGVGIALLPSHRFGEDVKLRVTRAEAVAQADRYLAAQGVKLAQYQQVAWLRDNVDGAAVKYLLQFRSVQDVDRLYRQATKPALWQVRYFRPLQKEEYSVFVDPESGSVFTSTHDVDDNAPGASLTPDQALALGRQFAISRGFNLAEFELQDSVAEKKKAREDYTLTWQARAGNPMNVGDAHYRVVASIAGDQVVSFTRYFKLPEDWLRNQSARTLANVLLWAATLTLGSGLIGGGLWLFVRQVRADRLHWMKALSVSVAVGVMFLLSELNSYVAVKQQYSTSLPLRTFDLEIAVSYLVVFLVVALAAWVMVAFALGLHPDAWRVFSARARRVWARDAAVGLAVALAAGAGLDNLTALVYDRFHAYADAGGQIVSGALSQTIPAAAFFLQSLWFDAVFVTAGLAVLISLAVWVWGNRPWWMWPALALLAVGLGSPSAHSAGQFFTDWSLSLVQLLAGLVVVAFFLRDNVAAYLAVAFTLPLADPLISLLTGTAPFYRWNGIALACVAALVLAWLLLPRVKSQPA
ncbi:MAG TPA: CPBP family glutamic-type intramembrane protease [Terriglobia bacterium]|nr:CPBP family glutamic-type intramembrane protease [Terriglobia bacterium]